MLAFSDSVYTPALSGLAAANGHVPLSNEEAREQMDIFTDVHYTFFSCFTAAYLPPRPLWLKNHLQIFHTLYIQCTKLQRYSNVSVFFTRLYSMPGITEKQRKKGRKFPPPTKNPQTQIYQTIHKTKREDTGCPALRTGAVG